MEFSDCPVVGAKVVTPRTFSDERGSFTRTWCRDEFRQLGVDEEIVQCNRSTNIRAGTLRGMHYQVGPQSEAKLVSCLKGRLYDVILDVRRDSASFGKWFGMELSADSGRAIFIPKGVAHGFVTLDDDTELLYLMSAYYSPEDARGVRWNDAAFSISWPTEVTSISERDRDFPDFELSADLDHDC